MVALTGVANADIKEKGGYVGASIGYAGYDKGGFEGYYKDKDSGSFGIYGGYKFNRYFALEGRLLNLGKYKVQEPGEGPTSDISYSIISGHLVGLLPLGESNWELMAQAGLGSGRYKVTGEESANGRDTAYSLGVGVRWTPTPAFTMQLSADGYTFRVREDSLPEETFKTNIGVIQFAGQWNF